MSTRCLICIVMFTCQCVAQEEIPQVDGMALARAFVQTNRFSLVQTLGELPEEEYELLVGDSHYFAEVGEDYNQRDVVGENRLPGAQHLVSFLSDDLVGMLFVGSGSSGTFLYAVLKQPGAAMGCIYGWKNWPLSGLRIGAVQEALVDDSSPPDIRRIWTASPRAGIDGPGC